MNGIWSKIVCGAVGCATLSIIWFVVITIIALPTMWLWNWLVVYIFGLPRISFWMAAGLALLVSLLFGKIKVNNK